MSDKIIDYMIAESPFYSTFVSELIKTGWQPFGSVYQVESYTYQPMVKYATQHDISNMEYEELKKDFIRLMKLVSSSNLASHSLFCELNNKYFELMKETTNAE